MNDVIRHTSKKKKKNAINVSHTVVAVFCFVILLSGGLLTAHGGTDDVDLAVQCSTDRLMIDCRSSSS